MVHEVVFLVRFVGWRPATCALAHITGLCCEEGLGSIGASHTQPRSASECGLSLF